MAAVVLEPGVYFIQNLGTGTVVDLERDSANPGTKIQGYQKRELDDQDVSAQLWIVYQVDGSQDVYKIRNAGSRTYMDLTGGNAANETPIVGNPGSDSESQKWVITRNSANTAYVVRNVASGTFVDLLDGNAANGTRINGWAGSGPSTTNSHQLWLIERA